MTIYFTRHILLSLILSFSAIAHAETITGRVVGVSDGDTLTVLDASNTQYKIRLAAIDAPEKAQPFGQRGKQKLSELLAQTVMDVQSAMLIALASMQMR